MPYPEWTRDDAIITTDPARVDLDVVHGYLTRAYWCEGIPRETVRRSIEHSIPFSVFSGGRMNIRTACASGDERRR